MIPYRTRIEERPESVNTRKEHGHWEGDAAVSRQSKQALIARLSVLPPAMRRSLTFDNGQENRRHYQLHDAIGIQTYFCNPYRSWEKGSVENAVGLTRRMWPKKTDYALISEEEVATLEYRLNTRPRKRFDYLTPLEYAAGVALSS